MITMIFSSSNKFALSSQVIPALEASESLTSDILALNEFSVVVAVAVEIISAMEGPAP